jgi:DNA-binding transcriptional MerR regulator
LGDDVTAFTVSEVAGLAGITVRTLHHYDERGLLSPQERSDAGYRLYSRTDLERLQEILFWRELGFALDEIADVIDDPNHDRTTALRRQRALIEAKVAHLRRLIDSIDAAIDANERGTAMNEQEMFEVFGDFDPREYEAEVEGRWSGELLDESRRRTATYSKEQWTAAMAEAQAATDDLAAAMRHGVAATDPQAMDAAERHRVQIDRWFYPCSHEVHVGLGEMYVADPRFTAHYDEVEPGLAAYVRDAIEANAARAGG